jgi:hypothetical protein
MLETIGEARSLTNKGETKMRKHTSLFLTGTASLIALSGAFSCLSGIPLATAQREDRQNVRTTERPLFEVLERIGLSGGVIALGDSTVQGIRVPMPARATTPGNVEQQIKTIVRALPEGTTWVKLYLPAPADRRWNGDTVAQYAMAQAQLTGKRIGGETPPGTIEILGQQVAEEQGKAYVTGLKLKLVYLITNPTSQKTNQGPLTPAQIQQFLTLDTNARFQAIMQAHQAQMQMQDTFHLLWKQLAPEEAAQFKQMLAEQMEKGGKGGKP